MRGGSKSIRRVLFLNQYFPPDTSATSAVDQRLVEALSEAGYAVRVIAGRPSYDLEMGYGGLVTPMKAKTVRVERVCSTTLSRRRMICRVLNYLSYIALTALRALGAKADVVITMTDPPIVGLLGALTSVIRGIPFIYNIQDLHPEMALASGMIRRGLLAR